MDPPASTRWSTIRVQADRISTRRNVNEGIWYRIPDSGSPTSRHTRGLSTSRPSADRLVWRARILSGAYSPAELGAPDSVSGADCNQMENLGPASASYIDACRLPLYAEAAASRSECVSRRIRLTCGPPRRLRSLRA